MKRGSTFPNVQDTQLGRRIDLEPGGEEGVDLRMAPLSTLSGVVRDEYGDPVGGVPVELLQQQYRDARQRLVSVGSPQVTDDLGRYRFYGLTLISMRRCRFERRVMARLTTYMDMAARISQARFVLVRPPTCPWVLRRR